MHRRRFIALALLSAAAVGCAAPVPVSWDPQPLAVVMEPNAFQVFEPTIRASGAVGPLELSPSPDLRPLLSIVPSEVAAMDAGARRRVRVAVLLPPTAPPGRRISGRVDPGLRVTIDVAPPTPEGALQSVRLALEYGEEAAYLAQVAPARRAAERRTFAQLTDTARAALAQTLQTAEPIALEERRAEYRIYLLLDRQRLESSIVLERSADGIWRVARF